MKQFEVGTEPPVQITSKDEKKVVVLSRIMTGVTVSCIEEVKPKNVKAKLTSSHGFDHDHQHDSSGPALRLGSLARQISNVESSSSSYCSEELSSEELSIMSSEDAADQDPLLIDEIPLTTSTGTVPDTDVEPPPTVVVATTSNKSANDHSFMVLRVTYLLVTLVVMLADGLQGTHLYVLYEGYGYSVASLYCLGFLTGGFLSPVTGPLVDHIGRKRAAVLYCILEIFINGLEQFPFLSGLIVSRMIGGFTTNLLNSVFETWLDTEYRRRGLEKEKYEIIMRDSVIVSNSAAIGSGYLAHVLAHHYGPVGPFRGAVTCTAIALAVILAVWSENYGKESAEHSDDSDNEVGDNSNEMDEADDKSQKKVSMFSYLREAITAFREDSKMLRVGIIQGLSEGSVQIFVFLWSPALRQFALASTTKSQHWGLDEQGEPAYGLIFGSYMAAGVLGGLLTPTIRKKLSDILSPPAGCEEEDDLVVKTLDEDGEEVQIRPMAVEFLAAFCYSISSVLLMAPCLYSNLADESFTSCLTAFLIFEFMIGMMMPCEGVIRSLYFPANARASVMSLPRILVNGAVALGVVSTNYVRLETAFQAVSCLLFVSAVLQLSLISSREWSSLLCRVQSLHQSLWVRPSSFLVTSWRLSTTLPSSSTATESTKIKTN